MKKAILCRSICCFFSLISVAGHIQGQDAYPMRPIRYIVAFPAGASTDISARRVAQYISVKTGQPAIVENRPGANGFLACETVARASPDGYTILFTATTTHGANPALFKKLPYDPIKDFAPVGRVGETGMFVVVPPDSPAQSVSDLTKLAKSRPGKLFYGSGNASSQVAVEMYKSSTGTDIVNVPYKGIPQAVQDLIAKRLDFMIADIITTLPLVQRGQLRALAVTTPKRSAKMADVPTMQEIGFNGYVMTSWTAMFAPAGTPRPVINTLNSILREALATPEILAAYAATGAEATPSTPDELGEFVREEIAKWSKVAKAAGIEPE